MNDRWVIKGGRNRTKCLLTPLRLGELEVIMIVYLCLLERGYRFKLSSHTQAKVCMRDLSPITPPAQGRNVTPLFSFAVLGKKPLTDQTVLGAYSEKLPHGDLPRDLHTFKGLFWV